MLKPTSAKLTGTPKSESWAQVYDFKPENPEKFSKRGYLVAVISGKSKIEKTGQEIDTIAFRREILARLHEEYYGDINKSPFNALRESVDKVIKEFADTWELEISAASYVEDVVYLCAGGGGQAGVFRNSRFIKILEKGEKTVTAASGRPQPGDIYILGNQIFFGTFGEGTLRASLQKSSIDETIEFLAPKTHSDEKFSSLGVALIKFFETETDELKKVEIPEKESREVTPPSLNKSEQEERTIKLKSDRDSLFDTVATKFANVLNRTGKKLPEKRVYVRKSFESLEESKQRKTAISVGAVLLFLLFISIFFGIRQKNLKQEREFYEEKISQANHNLEEAAKLSDLNPTRARELFFESDMIIKELQEREFEGEELTLLSKQIREGRGEILGEYEVEVENFLDLDLLSEGFSGSDMSASLEKVFVLDDQRDRVAEVEIGTKKAEVIGGPSRVEGARSIAAYSDRVFLTKSGGIYEIGQEDLVTENEWQDSSPLIASYAGNLYVLDKSDSQIIRFSGTLDGFGSGSDWLAPGIEVDLSDSVSWSIDGSVWVLHSDASMTKFVNGVPERVGLGDVFPELSPSLLYTNEELENLYILDKENSRVVVFGKEGSYKAQYLNEEFGRAIDFAVSEKESKIVILTGSQLKSAELPR